MSGFFDDLEAQLQQAAVRASGASKARRRVGLRRTLRLAPLLAAVLVPVVVAAIVLTAVGPSGKRIHSSAGGHPAAKGPLRLAELDAKYFNTAWPTVLRHDPACAPRGGLLNGTTGTSYGQPGRALLSILGVLRRPATQADRLPRSLGGAESLTPGVVYVRYIRFARVDAGVRYYVAVAHLAGTPGAPHRCFAELRSELRRAEPRHLPAWERNQIARFAMHVLRNGPLEVTRAHDGVFLIGRGGVGGADAAHFEKAGLVASTGATIYGLVPDGVATVGLPLRHAPGHPGLTIVTKVVNNVFVVRAPRGFSLPLGEIWVSRSQRLIKRINLNR